MRRKLQQQCSETSAYKIQIPENYPVESIQHSEHGKNWKSRIFHIYEEKTATTVFRNVGIQNSDTGKLSSRKHTTFRTGQKLEIKNISHLWGEKCNNSVPKRRHTKFRCREITQQKAYNIQNTAKIGNQEYFTSMRRKVQQQCSETSAYKIQMPGNYPVESIQHSEHGESLNSLSFVYS